MGMDKKLNISYQIIKNAKIAGYEQCIKHYLFGHYSNMRVIAPEDWEKIVMLPLQKWVVRPGFKAPY
jgi:PhoPQ-activated pathogenicity-related protein